MKGFKDLIFEPIHREYFKYDGSKKAVIRFDNGYSIEVGQGRMYHSSNDEYEVQIFKDGERATNIVHWSDLWYCDEEEVTNIMIKVQEIKSMNYNDRRKAEFIPYLEKVKSLGYKVFVSTSTNLISAYIVNKDGVVSCIAPYRFGGVRIRTIHHGRRDCGNGFMVAQMIGVNDIDEYLIEQSFKDVPSIFHNSIYEGIKKITIEELKELDKKFDEKFVEF